MGSDYNAVAIDVKSVGLSKFEFETGINLVNGVCFTPSCIYEFVKSTPCY